MLLATAYSMTTSDGLGFYILAIDTLTAVGNWDEILRAIVMQQEEPRSHCTSIRCSVCVCVQFLDAEGIDAIDWHPFERFQLKTSWTLMNQRI